ncbi:thermonuclease family protein [Neisseria perflava]|uniref:thermonuclease family protein n=1 Tax=Neisseria perflava TaxID=33053 RepID=UPI00201A3EA9|nr:thermonuclease family protein [Neisseria perflava]MCL5079541.1 thermonuclease family protein [Neisseria perflava]
MSKLTNTLMALLLPVVILYGYFSLLNENEPQNVVEVTKSSLTDTEKWDGTSQTPSTQLLSPNPEADINCKVVGVTDGDTLTCLLPENKRIKVRLDQIDAPEHKQDFGKVAKKALSEYVYGKNVSLKTNGRDKYGRTIAEVYHDQTNINKVMVENGLAWVYRDYMTDIEYLELENAARSQSKGLWSQPNPIYPSEFRHGEQTRKVTTEVKPNANISGGNFTCAGKRFCREMRSCAEANFYLNHCGVSRLDRDHDGIPCESIC